MSKKKQQFQARLENQKAQLERHGNFAEVVIRTTPEGTDMINFARLWEHILVQADRQTRGYIAQNEREEFDKTRKDFYKCVDMMVTALKDAIDRHDLDLIGSNFISRIAQRYHIAERAPTSKGEKKASSGGDKPASEKKADKEPVKEAKKDEAPAKKPTEETTTKPESAKKAPASKKPASSGGALGEQVDGF